MIKNICISGSTKFKDEIQKLERYLTLQGNMCMVCCFFQHTDGDEFSKDQIQTLVEIHKRRIDLCDEMWVVNPMHYIGISVLDEIVYTMKRNKRIYFTHPYEQSDPGQMLIDSIHSQRGMGKVNIDFDDNGRRLRYYREGPDA